MTLNSFYSLSDSFESPWAGKEQCPALAQVRDDWLELLPRDKASRLADEGGGSCSVLRPSGDADGCAGSLQQRPKSCVRDGAQREGRGWMQLVDAGSYWREQEAISTATMLMNDVW